MNDLKVWAYNDIFNPVTDLNENFATVKNAIESLEGGAETDEQDISDLKTKVGSDALVTTAQDLSGAVNELDDDLNHASTGVIARLTSAENSIGTLQTQAGNATLVTTAQTLSGAVNELDDDLNHANTGVIARVGALETQAGNTALTTTAQTLSGAVNELKGRIDVAESLELANSITINADGVKTYNEILQELTTQLNTKLTNEPNSRIKLARLVVPEITTFVPLDDLVFEGGITYANLKQFSISSANFQAFSLSLSLTTPNIHKITIDSTGTFTHTDFGSDVPTVGGQFALRFYYQKKEGE